ncbi:Tetratricopeptide-like helical [Lasiodiplodia theobromae]|uniref:Uncharacterized protein n=1 Tax=Lasiodiplodia theobromae TaxID=45133 RepID=A0A5N5DSP1_9PEZI|nr:hypothetical protein DBV05_g727 [Lasiodiplodia theobromae]KAF9635719.1 Tetratricopeptide-like helical [Lasiodiplodia theobromae]
MEVLGKMRDLGSELNGATVKKLCLDHQVAIDDLPFIARACLYTRNTDPVRKLGKSVLIYASANESADATLRLLRSAMIHDKGVTSRLRQAYNSPELAVARNHLRKLVEENHPEAMVLQARRFSETGQRKEAIAMLRAAIESGATALQPYDDDAASMHKKYSSLFLHDLDESRTESPWTTLAKLERDEGNETEAEEAFQLGADKDDDPRAFQALASTVPRYSRTWFEYMTKAASSGSWTAAKYLGEFYTAPLASIPVEDEELRTQMQHLEENDHKIEWWYYYLNNRELELIGEPPGTKIVGADFWRGYHDPDLDSATYMVELNQRQALALEWYEIAWRGQATFSDDRDLSINLAIQEIIEKALPHSGELKHTWTAKKRHHALHHWTDESRMFENFMVAFDDLKKRIFR